MGGTLSKALIDASNAARDAFLKAIDPAGMAAAAPASAGPRPPGGGGPPPPAMRAPVRRLLQPAYYGNTFFQQISGDFGKHDKILQTSSWDFGSWFNYFFIEARDTATPEAKGRIMAVLFDLEDMLQVAGQKLVAKPSFGYPAALSTNFHRWLALEPDGVPLAVLTYLLEEGFETFKPVSAKSGAMSTGEGNAEDPKVAHCFGAYFDLQSATNTQPIERHTTKEYLLFYRGDSRPPSMVVAHGGAKCRADLADWRESANVEAPWHPWKDADQISKTWIRKGNADNDYYTVNSIGMDFHISCAYPMLRIGEIDRTLTGHIDEWTDAERARLRATHKADFCRMKNLRSHKEEFVLCDKARVYVCVFKDDTSLSPTYTRNTYPEMGVRTVELEQIIAWFEIERFHYNESLTAAKNGGARSPALYESPKAGSTMTILVKDWGWMFAATGARNVLGIENPDVLGKRFDSFKNTSFEIDHSRLRSRTDLTFDLSTRKTVGNVWARVQPASLLK